MADHPVSNRENVAISAPRKRRIFIPLVVILTIPVVVLVAGVAVGAYFGLVQTSRSTAMSSKQTAAHMVTELNALSVMPAVVFGDQESMQRSIDDLAQNPEVLAAGLWQVGPDGAISHEPLARFRRAGAPELDHPQSAAPGRSIDEMSINIWEPVVDPDRKTIAVIGARFSTEREAVAITELSRSLWYASLVTALCLAAAIVLVLQRLVVAPISRLQRAAEHLERGEDQAAQTLQGQVRIEDEVVRLGQAFVDMSNAVRDREERLALRNGELRLILDSVDQGFLTATPDGTLLRERSAVVEKWLGTLPRAAKVWDLAGRIDPATKGWTELAWAQVVEGLLPLEMSLEQLPKRLVSNGRHYDFAYHPVMPNGELERVVIVLTDATAEVERQCALAEQHEFSVLVDQFVRDRRAFIDFWNESAALVSRIIADPNGDSTHALRRDIHTLKGNARFFGLSRLSSMCHSLEDAMQERGASQLNEKEREAVRELWESLRRRMEPLLRGATAFLEISEDEYERLVRSLRSPDVPREKLVEIVEGLAQEPTEWRLNRATKTLDATCQKLGKSPVTVEAQHNDLRMPPGRFDPFWSVVQHVLVNAIDHGIESDEERFLLKKPVPGHVRLCTKLEAQNLVIEVEDDGRGIDWEMVRTRAQRARLPARTQDELVAALLSEGFSLKEDVSTISGRGVGLAALNSVLVALGGRLELTSEIGRGSKWRFLLPMGALSSGRVAHSSSPAARRIGAN